MLEKLKKQIEKGDDNIKKVGQILLEICEANRTAAEIVEQDLENQDMSIEKCFAKMRETARKGQKGGCYYMGDAEAEKIIREFYGIPKQPKKARVTSQHRTEIIDLADLMDL